MSANINYVSDSDFNTQVLEAEGLTVVDFYADWCMPCKMLGPIMEELAESNAGKVKISKLNVDESQVTSSSYRVMSIPTIVFFKGGKEVDRIIGLTGKEELQEVIDRLV